MTSLVSSLQTVTPCDDVLNLLFDTDDGILISDQSLAQQQEQQSLLHLTPNDFGELPDSLLEQTLGSSSSSNDSSESLSAFDLDTFLSGVDNLASHSSYNLGEVAADTPACGPVRNGRRRKHPVLPYTIADCDDCDLDLDDVGVGDLSGQLDGRPGQPLALSDEELRLVEQMGVQLPEEFPLTREEQKALRTIRRKIRNKISAKNSRAKRQEYVRNLEIRAKTSAVENAQLKHRCTGLEQQNRKLMAAMRRLQAMLQSTGLTTAGHNKAKGTGLFLLCLSFALFMAPQFSVFNSSLPGIQQQQAGRVVAKPSTSRRILELTDTVWHSANDRHQNAMEMHQDAVRETAGQHEDTATQFQDTEGHFRDAEGQSQDRMEQFQDLPQDEVSVQNKTRVVDENFYREL